jgi:hypothetical protein
MENKVFENLRNKNITESSLKLYISNLKRLNGGVEPKNLNFLKNVDAILEKIKDYKPNTRRSYIISIVTLLKHEPKMKKLYDAYYKILMEYNTELKTNNTKSETQKENWISQEEVNKIYKDIEDEIKPKLTKKKLSFEEWNELQRYMVLSLYTLQPPRRNLDYQYMIVVNKYDPEKIDKKYNYLDIEGKKFHFNNYKTKGTYQTQSTDVSPELFEVIQQYLKYHPLKNHLKKKYNFIPLLVDFDGVPFESKNSITRILNKIFKKNIGSSMLRNIYLTDRFGDKVQELQDTAHDMGTSSSTIQNNYIKIDLDEE